MPARRSQPDRTSRASSAHARLPPQLGRVKAEPGANLAPGDGQASSQPASCPWPQGENAPAAPQPRGDAVAPAPAPSRYQRLGTQASARLGAGSYGVVHAAWDTVCQVVVAVKTQSATSDDAVRELACGHTLPDHGHVIQLLDQYVCDGKLHLVYPYMACSLRDAWSRACGLLSFYQADRYGRHIALGTAHLHSCGIAHRDLSLSNVLLDASRDAAVIADFGLAASAADFLIDRTVTTLWFRAPEVLLGFSTLEHGQAPLDLWSLGCVVGALWCGTVLFGAASGTDDAVLRRQFELLGAPQTTWPDVAQAPKWAAVSVAARQAPPQRPGADTLLGASLRKWPRESERCDLLWGLL